MAGNYHIPVIPTYEGGSDPSTLSYRVTGSGVVYVEPNKAVAFPLWACLRCPDGDLVTVAMWTSWPCSDSSAPTETDSDRAPHLTSCRLNNPELLHRCGGSSVFPHGHTHPSLPSPEQEKEQEVIKAEPEASLDWICTMEENQDGGTLQKPGDLTAVTCARLLFPDKQTADNSDATH